MIESRWRLAENGAGFARAVFCYTVSMKKRLLLAITKASWGGAQKYVYDIATLCKDEYEVAVMCGQNEFDGENIFLSKLAALGIPVYEIASLKRDVSLRDELRSISEMRSVLRAFQPDIIHLNSSKMALTGALAARLEGVKKRVYTVHGFPFIDTSRAAWKNFMLKILTRLGFLFLTHIITISQRECDIVSRWREARKKVSLIYNGFTPVAYLEKTTALEMLLQDAPQKIKELAYTVPVIGSIAELTRNKGVDILLQTLKEVSRKNDFLYVHVGTGEGEKVLQAIIKQRGLESNIYFAGFIPQAATYLKAFDLFVLASRKEGTPYVLLEAAAAEVPIVATDVGAVKEIIPSAQYGTLVPPEDSSLLADALTTTLELSADVVDQMTEKLHTHVNNQFSKARMKELLFAVYERG